MIWCTRRILFESGEWLHHSLHLVQLDTDRDEVVRLATDFVRNIKPE